MTNSDKKINFIIDHIDPLGQGVFKNKDQIYFIPKTLPGESGEAEVFKAKKNINFAKLLSLKKSNDDRIEPDCPHYNSCNGCHFLHTNYESEISFKESSLLRMASFDFKIDNVTIHRPPRRFFYRNRIQLHYNKRADLIGFVNPQSKKIVSVPECMMPTKELSIAYKEFLKTWKTQAPSLNNGHVELYLKSGELRLSWNKRYADSGFTQVFKEMNEELKSLVDKSLDENESAFDLFGGDGNLSNKLSNKYIIDYYGDKSDSSHTIHMDLFDDNSLNKFAPSFSPDTFIVDPPRKGFPLLKDWVEKYSPQKIIYVSCHSQTMFRDLKAIKSSYNIEELHLLDLFPSTYHFESMAILRLDR